MGCEYCDEGEKNKTLYEFKLGYNKESVRVDSENMDLIVRVQDDGFSTEIFIDISFCPMCGMYLGEFDSKGFGVNAKYFE